MDANSLSQKEFKLILEKYLNGICTPQEQKLVEDWYEKIGSGNHFLLDDRQHQQIETRLWNKLASQSPHKANKKTSYWRAAALAASLLLTVVLFLLFKPSPPSASTFLSKAADFQMKLSNEGAVPKQFLLEDGSSILLQPNSQLLYTKPFKSDKREVKLIGAAFFDIAHDEKRPFLVYAKDVVTKVLGTSFTIDAHQKDAAITVSVKTGRVFVSRPGQNTTTGNKEAILRPNQKAVFDLTKNELTTTLTDDPKPVLSNPDMKAMNFEEERVSVILRDLEKMYGVEISFDENILRACVLTTEFSEENLYDRLKIICKAIDGTFEIRETKIVLQSHGCDN
jgi:transmembrane sensor